MTNIILLIFLFLGFLFAIYDQVIMNKLKGETKLNIPLKKQKGIDTWLLLGLISLSFIYGVQNKAAPFTLYLLATCIILAIYLAFLRTPRLLFKKEGFFFANLYFKYSNIYQVNIAELPPNNPKTKNNSLNTNEKILVIDLQGGRRLLAYITNDEDIQKAVDFFGGYKDTQNTKSQ